MRLIIATNNDSKLKEIKAILKGIDCQIISLKQLPRKIRIVENGKTFAENAVKKAVAVSKLYADDYALGEDSGLEVDFLRGAPGVRSKRYASAGGDQTKNNRKLLKALANVPEAKRGACFRCTLALVKNRKVVRIFEGRLRGKISTAATGGNGFGYDPVFYLTSYKKTVAQLPLDVKNKISHRARAFNKLKKYLSKLSAVSFQL